MKNYIDIKIFNFLTFILITFILSTFYYANNKMAVIAYGTSEFDEFVKNAPISLDEAWEIQLNYMKKNTLKFLHNFYDGIKLVVK